MSQTKSEKTGQPPYRTLAITELEVKKLLKLSKVARLEFPPSLQKRLVEMLEDFEDDGLKLKEQMVRARSNSFYVKDQSAIDQVILDKRREQAAERDETYEEVACLTAKEMRRLFDREKAKAQEKRDKAKAKIKNGGTNGRHEALGSDKKAKGSK